jgi:hypothetical protein
MEKFNQPSGRMQVTPSFFRQVRTVLTLEPSGTDSFSTLGSIKRQNSAAFYLSYENSHYWGGRLYWI